MRARNIKPEFFKSDTLGTCSPLARLLFQGLWCMADHEGRLRYRPRRIKAEVLPYDDVDISALISELVQADPADPMLIAYGGTPEAPAYLWIPKFRQHQCPNRRERQKPSTVPACPQDGNAIVTAPETDPANLTDPPQAEPVHAEDPPGPIPGSVADRPASNAVPKTDARGTDRTHPTAAIAAQNQNRNPNARQAVVEAWNALATECGLKVCRALDNDCWGALQERWKDPSWRERYPDALERLRHVHSTGGGTDLPQRPNLAWFLRPDTVSKLLQGAYDDSIEPVGAGRSPAPRAVEQSCPLESGAMPSRVPPIRGAAGGAYG